MPNLMQKWGWAAEGQFGYKKLFFFFLDGHFFEGGNFLGIWGVPPRVEMDGFGDGGGGSISELIIYRAIY